jgi:CRP/FNR family transcriptional regulator/CRP/FNR family cyclic AMP-dependent transcriptional regulator
MNREEIETFVSGVPLFKEIGKSDLEAVCSVVFVRKFRPGEILVYEHDENDRSFFIIVNGRVHVTVLTSEGKQAILASLGKGEFFGEMSILDGEPRSATVIAATECTVLMLYRKPFIDLLYKFPRITVSMLAAMSRRLRVANKHMNTLSLISVYGRVAEVLIQLAAVSGKKEGGMSIIDNRPTHQAIADMAGTSRETVSRILSQLKKKRYISIDKNRIVIFNEEKLYD